MLKNELQHPSDVKDDMSYCDFPSWASDYGWDLQYRRALTLGSWGAPEHAEAPTLDSRFSTEWKLAGVIDGSGRVIDTWSVPQAPTASAESAEISVEFSLRDGSSVDAFARSWNYSEGDHLYFESPAPIEIEAVNSVDFRTRLQRTTLLASKLRRYAR